MNVSAGTSLLFANLTPDLKNKLIHGSISGNDLSDIFSQITAKDITLFPPYKPKKNEIFIYKSQNNSLSLSEGWKKDGYSLWTKTYHSKLLCSKKKTLFICLESQFEEKQSIFKRIAYLGCGYVLVAYSSYSVPQKDSPEKNKTPNLILSKSKPIIISTCSQPSTSTESTSSIRSSTPKHIPRIIVPAKRVVVTGSSSVSTSATISASAPKNGPARSIRFVLGSSNSNSSLASSPITVKSQKTLGSKNSPILIKSLLNEQPEEITTTPQLSKVTEIINLTDEVINSTRSLKRKQPFNLRSTFPEDSLDLDSEFLPNLSVESIHTKVNPNTNRSKPVKTEPEELIQNNSESKEEPLEELLSKVKTIVRVKSDSQNDLNAIQSASKSDLEDALRRVLSDENKNLNVLKRKRDTVTRSTAEIRLVQLVRVCRAAEGTGSPIDKKYISDSEIVENETQDQSVVILDTNCKVTVSSMDKLLEVINPDMVSDCVPFRPASSTVYIYNRNMENWSLDGYYFLGDGTRIMQSKLFNCCVLQHKFAVLDKEKKLNRRFTRISLHFDDYVIVLYKGNAGVAGDRVRSRKLCGNSIKKTVPSICQQPRVTAVEIFNFVSNLTPEMVTEEVPHRPPGDSVFVYKPAVDPKDWNDWNNDGYPWKNDGRRILRYKDRDISYTCLIYAAIDTRCRVTRDFTRCVYYANEYIMVVYRGDSTLSGAIEDKKEYLISANRIRNDKNSVLTINGVVKFFNNFDRSQLSTVSPYLPEEADVYIYHREIETKQKDWLQDGYNWSISHKKRLTSPRHPKLFIDYMEYISTQSPTEEGQKLRRLVYNYDKFIILLYYGNHNYAVINENASQSNVKNGLCINVGLNSFKIRNLIIPNKKPPTRIGKYFNFEKGISRARGNIPDEEPAGFEDDLNVSQSPEPKRRKVDLLKEDTPSTSAPASSMNFSPMILIKLDRILQQQAVFDDRLLNLSSMVRRLDRRISAMDSVEHHSSDSIDLPVSLPIDNVNELNEFDEWLDNKTKFDATLRYFKYLLDEEYVLHVTMCSLFHDTIISLLSWSKVRRKIDLSERKNIVRLIITIMKSSDRSLTGTVIRKGINDWLKFTNTN